jgi:hypothetical protein
MEALVDGVVVATESATGAIRPSNYDLELGRDSERKGYYFNGTIDEVRIYNRALSQQEIQTYMTVPEFPSLLIVPLLMIPTLLAAIVYRRKHLVEHP